MLALDQQYPLEIEDNRRNFPSHWKSLREEVLKLSDYRISTSSKEWYQSHWMFQKDTFISATDLRKPSDVNHLSKGILGEVFFQDACMQMGINCQVTEGCEDIMGADFKLTHGGEVRYFDVSVNSSPRGVERKSNVATFPTLFIPWYLHTKSLFDPRDPLHDISYAEEYLKKGKFNGREYMERVLDINYEMLHYLRECVWKNIVPNCKLFSVKEFSFNRAGILYVNNLEGVLILLRKSIGKFKS